MIDKSYFDSLKVNILEQGLGQGLGQGGLSSGEHLFINLYAETSQFIRVNHAKIRQTGMVDDASLEISLIQEDANKSAFTGNDLRKITRAVTLTGNLTLDLETVHAALNKLRNDVLQLPVDPYCVLPTNTGSSAYEKTGVLIPPEDAAWVLLEPVQGIDVVGIYSAGKVIRALANSAGQSHWFATETFSFDYSFFTKSGRALKGVFAGSSWDQKKYLNQVSEEVNRLKVLEKAPKILSKGCYRTFLAPAALSELVSMLSWGALGEASIRQGESPLRLLRSGTQTLSPRFNLYEDFSRGDISRFNEEGVLAPESLPVIHEGKLSNSLVSSRSAKEYQVLPNGAAAHEGLRSPTVQGGKLEEAEILKILYTGLYLSNLHYLNWSDQPGGRITGMTRYACFYVEKGEIICPIENMRFDDTIFNLLGSELLDLTCSASYIPDVGTYNMRSVGGSMMPGLLVSKLEFTL